MTEIRTLCRRLEEAMAEYGTEDVAVAFSGGVDSSLLLAAACRAAEKTGKAVYAVTLHTRLHTACDLETAKAVAKELGAAHVVLSVDELEQAGIRKNPVDRCYRCKRLLFSRVQEFAKEKGIAWVLDGTNEDDLHVYRPGLKALKELGIISPLADLKITKEQVKAMAAAYGISVASRPATPCMATRLPYGADLDYEALERIAKGEEWLREEIGGNVRLRLHGEVARLEVDIPAMERVLKIRERLTGYLKSLGFVYLTLDLEGFRSGSMDLHVKEGERQA